MDVWVASVGDSNVDGFYEQRLVQDQVLQLTGRRFLAGYYSDQEQYQALMDNAASLASAYNLMIIKDGRVVVLSGGK